MSAREQAELDLIATGQYNNPAKLAARMAFWDLGYKVEQACVGAGKLRPDDVSSCECKTAGGYTVAICTANAGHKCFMAQPYAPEWDEDAIKEKMGDCNSTWNWGPSSSLSPSAPIGAAIVDTGHSNLLIIGLAFLLLLSAWGRIR